MVDLARLKAKARAQSHTGARVSMARDADAIAAEAIGAPAPPRVRRDEEEQASRPAAPSQPSGGVGQDLDARLRDRREHGAVSAAIGGLP